VPVQGGTRSKKMNEYTREYTIPGIFGDRVLDQVLSIFDGTSALETYKPGYPTDIVEVSDDNGQVTGYEITVALAGIKKENVEITTDIDTLSIVVKKSDEPASKNRVYLQKGISQRFMELRYGLHGIDKTKIKASFNEGLLKVELQIADEVKPRAITIG